MAREHMHRGQLVGCPVCGSKVADIAIGLRDFAWANEALPGRVGGMDIDFCLTQNATKRMLFIELKPKGDIISRGATLTYQLLNESPRAEVWAAWDLGGGQVEACEMMADGEWGKPRKMSRASLANKVNEWWLEGLDEG